LIKAAAGKLLRTDKVRADTTVVEGDVGYPTDSGLLAQGVGTICRTVGRMSFRCGNEGPDGLCRVCGAERAHPPMPTVGRHRLTNRRRDPVARLDQRRKCTMCFASSSPVSSWRK
jgi:hypothetical protein